MANDAGTPGLWHVADEARGCVKSWDDEGCGVFYSVRSGDTHLIDALAVELHDLLIAKPMDESALLQALDDVIVPGGEAAAAAELREHLRRLQGFGLLRESSV